MPCALCFAHHQVNFNDGSAGGEVLEGNLIMNFVRETGDHGMFNSWDRQPIVHDDVAGEVALNPLTHQIHKNFIFNRNWLGSTNSGYSIDYDDGSSQYNATHNFLVYGAFKVRDGINRAHSHNIIYGKPADYQVSEKRSFFVSQGVLPDEKSKFYQHRLGTNLRKLNRMWRFAQQCDGYNSTTMEYNTIIGAKNAYF